MNKESVKTKSSFPIWRWLIPVVLVGAGLTYWFLNRSTTVGEIEGVETLTVEQGHQDGGIDYLDHPPMGGIHNPVWINCGVYDSQVQLEKAVHSLEHGAVWITYTPDLAASDVETLRTLVGDRTYVLLSPYMFVPLPKPIVAVAWGVRLGVDSASDPRLAQFLQKYVNGPQTPEPGAVCTNGEGNPL
jgi:Protein of unknown function (DUF3105)